MVKLDLGCGDNKRDGCTGIDRMRLPGVDVVADLDDGIPFGDGSVDEIYATHFLEHMRDVDFMLREIHRVGKGGAKVHISVPNGCNPVEAWTSPHHVRAFTRNSLDFYCVGVQDFPQLFKMVDRPNVLHIIPFIRELSPFRELKFELEVVRRGAT